MNLLTLLSLRTSCIPLRVLSERELMHEIEAPREMPLEGIFTQKPEKARHEAPNGIIAKYTMRNMRPSKGCNLNRYC